MIFHPSNKESSNTNNGIPVSQSKRKTVFLFKSPKENEADKFVETLEENGFSSIAIPVLSFHFINQSALKSCLATLHLFQAIIFTSVRSVEAVANIIKEINLEQNISEVQTFVVGHTTAEAARKAGFSPQGEISGNAEELAKWIVQKAKTERVGPMLYPCSSIHRDTLLDILRSNDLEVTEIIAYETHPNEQLKGAVQEALQLRGMPDFAVFFSPSGFQFTLETVNNDTLPLDKLRIIALGPATQKAISDKGYTPFGVAEKPDPKSLLKLLIQS